MSLAILFIFQKRSFSTADTEQIVTPLCQTAARSQRAAPNKSPAGSTG